MARVVIAPSDNGAVDPCDLLIPAEGEADAQRFRTSGSGELSEVAALNLSEPLDLQICRRMLM